MDPPYLIEALTYGRFLPLKDRVRVRVRVTDCTITEQFSGVRASASGATSSGSRLANRW